MTDTDQPRYVDPDTWFERLYAEPVATEDQAEADAPVNLAKAEPDDQAEDDPEPAGPAGWWRRSQADPESVPDDEDQADSGERPFDLRALADHLAGVLSETPEERAQRRHAEEEARYVASGETAAERRQRHRADRRQREHRASMLMRVHHAERVRRFRRWVVLTGLSASLGYGFGAVQAATHLPPTVGGGALGVFWLIDLRTRAWGKVRVSQVRGAFPLALLVILRVPVASALCALLGLAPLLALTNHH
jgi:hypothetical protein